VPSAEAWGAFYHSLGGADPEQVARAAHADFAAAQAAATTPGALSAAGEAPLFNSPEALANAQDVYEALREISFLQCDRTWRKQPSAQGEAVGGGWETASCEGLAGQSPTEQAAEPEAPRRPLRLGLWFWALPTPAWRAAVERVRAFLQTRVRQTAGAAAATLLAGSMVIGLSGTSAVELPQGEDALTPLAQTIEVVSRRNMADLASRTMTAQLVDDPAALTGTEISADTQSNVGLVLNWDVSVLEEYPDAVLVLRRGMGDAPPQTPAEGVAVPLGDDPGAARDSGLQPDTSYSYTLFIQRPGEKPEVLARAVATTSRFPTELGPGQSLAVGERLTSPDNSFYVTVADDGAVVLFNNLNQKLWSLDTDPNPDALLALNHEGALVVAVGEVAAWTADATAPGVKLVLTSEGALQLLDAEGGIVWSSKEVGYQLRGGDSPYNVSPDGWTLPGAGPVSSPYGMRIHPIYGVLKMHSGVDMTSGRGLPIFAAHDGKVTRVYQDSGGNWTIEIDHGSSITTRYLHMDGLGGILVKEGDAVVAGEQIARTGSSGQSTGPHLHFEVSVGDATTDPVEFLKKHGVVLK
jgi:murein DD-endopeptidase MepM/ murein hydrolase activator NlpD